LTHTFLVLVTFGLGHGVYRKLCALIGGKRAEKFENHYAKHTCSVAGANSPRICYQRKQKEKLNQEEIPRPNPVLVTGGVTSEVVTRLETTRGWHSHLEQRSQCPLLRLLIQSSKLVERSPLPC